jgi:hypothetical protein
MREISDIDNEMAFIDEEVSYMLDMNKSPTISDEEKEENRKAVSEYRDKYFRLSDEREVREQELTDLGERHMQEANQYWERIHQDEIKRQEDE